MPTNIYLACLNSSQTNCNLLTPLSDYQPGTTLGSSEYSVVATQVSGQTLSDLTTNQFSQLAGDNSVFVQGSLILSVNRDVGIKKGDNYYFNIPLQLDGDTTIVYVQLKLRGTATDSDAWFGMKCTPDTDVSNQVGPWDSTWWEFNDTRSPSTPPVNKTYPAMPSGGQGICAWYSQAYTLNSIYLCDSTPPGGSVNDDLWIMITDAANYPTSMP